MAEETETMLSDVRAQAAGQCHCDRQALGWGPEERPSVTAGDWRSGAPGCGGWGLWKSVLC